MNIDRFLTVLIYIAEAAMVVAIGITLYVWAAFLWMLLKEMFS